MAASAILRRAPSSLGRISVPRLGAQAKRAQHRFMQPCTLRSRQFTSTSQGWAKKYTEDHEWVELSDDGASATIGISTYAANALGSVVYVELPEVDTEFNAGDTIGAVESVKSASDILAPVSGTVLESNETLGDKPGFINDSPEGEAWLAKITIKDEAELGALMDADAYKAFTEEVTGS